MSAGNDSSSANGRTMAFTTPNNSPARISVVAESMLKPLSISVAAQRPSAATRPRRMKPTMSQYLGFGCSWSRPFSRNTLSRVSASSQ